MSVPPPGPSGPMPGPPSPTSAPPGPAFPGGLASGQPNQPGAAPAAADKGKPRWVLVPIVGVLVLLLVNAGAYFGGRSYQGSRASQSCGSYRCIPRLDADKVLKALEEKGYTCTAEHIHRTCELRVGMVRFEGSLMVSKGLIHRISVKIFRAGADSVSETGLAFVNWFATLPYAMDEELSGQIRDWVAEQIDGNKDTKATIGVYEYILTNPEAHTVRLEIKEAS